MSLSERFWTDILEKRTSFLQTLTKSELFQLSIELQLELTGDTIDEWRKFLRDVIKSDRGIQVIQPTEKPAKNQESPQLPTMAVNYQIEPFDGREFDTFEVQLQCLITLNNVPEDKRVALLITKLTSKVLETLNHLCAPDKPTQKSYTDLLKLLEDRYNKSTSIPVDRAEFRKCNQTANESIEEYIIRLKKAAKKCNFKDFNDQVKEKLIDGVYSSQVKFELLKNGNQTLDDLTTLARTVEAAMLQTKMKMPAEEPTSSMFFVKQNEHSKQRRFPNKSHREPTTSSGKPIKCFCCGKNNHVKSECSLKNKYCSECGQQGHLYKMCPKTHKMNLLEINTDIQTEQNTQIEQSIQKLFSETDDYYNVYSCKSITNKIPPCLVEGSVNGIILKFELDTGSETSTILQKDLEALNLKHEVKKTNINFKNYDQTITQPLGIINNIQLKINNESKSVNLFVVENNKPRLLGRDLLNVFGMWPLKINNTEMTDPVNTIKEKFSEVFTPGWGNFKGDCISLKLKENAQPKCFPVRTVPFALKEKVTQEIKRLLDNKRIQPVTYSKWGTPVVPILKPDGSVRLCGDYKVTVNPQLEVDHFPLPHVEEIFNKLSGGDFYCELDLKEAYLQAPLDEPSQDLTVIVTEIGTFKYKYLPYGVSTGPGSFQRLMAQKLQDIPNVIVFIDNIYMCGKSISEMTKTLDLVLSKLKDCEFKLKVEKCKFFRKSLDVFGYRIDKKGIKIIKENIEPILNLDPPKNLTMLRSFLGKINYYGRFLKDLATTLYPLYECTRNGSFVWTDECQKAFDIIKKKLGSATNLTHYNPDQPLILTCDASAYGVSAIISNRGTDGVVRPIAFASKKLSDTEQKYTTLDKEAYAIIFGVTKFYNYTYGRSFELETDNSALTRILGPYKSIPRMAAKRLQHYAIFLSAFTYTIRHISTDRNPADYLSRLPKENDDTKYHALCINNTETLNANYIDESELKTLNWKLIQNNTKKDLVLSKVLRYCQDGWPERVSDKCLDPYYLRRHEISTDRDCIMWGHRIVIPENLRRTVLDELHLTHFGTTRMTEMAKAYFWWPKLNENIEKITNSCKLCLENRHNPSQVVPKCWPIPPGPWFRIHADFLGPLFGKMYLIIVDSYSKWPEAFQMTNIGSSLTITKFKEIYVRYGFPVHLVTDNGTAFTSHEFKEFCRVTGVKHSFTSPHYPATNGAAERFVETFKSHMKKIIESGKSHIYALSIFLFDYRTTTHKSSGVTPARLMMGRELRNRFSLLRPTPIYQNLVESQEKQLKYAKGARVLVLNEGDLVNVKDFRRGKKWSKGHIVKVLIPGSTFLVEVEGAKWKRHANQLHKLCTG
jgi:phage FluMu protein Com